MASDFELGMQALQQGNGDGAIEHLERACRTDPQDYRARTALGAAYGEYGRPLDAVRALEEAVRLEPRLPQGHYNLALALARAGRPAQAEAALRHTLLLHPDHPRALVALARIRGQPPPAPPEPTPAPPEPTAAPEASATHGSPGDSSPTGGAGPEALGFVLPPPGGTFTAPAGGTPGG